MIYVKFRDHCKEQRKEGLLCSICGPVLYENSDVVCIISWNIESDDEDDIEGNREVFTIIKSTIIERYELVRREDERTS